MDRRTGRQGSSTLQLANRIRPIAGQATERSTVQRVSGQSARGVRDAATRSTHSLLLWDARSRDGGTSATDIASARPRPCQLDHLPSTNSPCQALQSATLCAKA